MFCQLLKCAGMFNNACNKFVTLLFSHIYTHIQLLILASHKNERNEGYAVCIALIVRDWYFLK